MRHVTLLLALLTTGCGPLILPLSTRTTPEDQHQIDTMWDNMLTPASRVPRETLLDSILVYWLYQTGVDRLHLTSEKYLTHGKVVMEIDCDRASPDTDQFTLTILDDRGQTLRRERYPRPEIESRAQALWQFHPNSIPALTHTTTQPTTHPCEHDIERERRLKAIQSATQPAHLESKK